MTRSLHTLRLTLCAAAAALALPVAAMAQVPSRVEWRVEATAAGGPTSNGQVQLELSYRLPGHSSNYSHGVAFSDLAGFAAADLTAADTRTVRFRLHRDAGDFACEGQARMGQASGACTFAQNPAFAPALKSRGVAAPDETQAFNLAIADIGLSYVDELGRQAYAKPTPDDLVRAGQHGANLTYLKTMGGLGYRMGQVGDLIRARDHGVTATYVQGLAAAGYARVPIEDLLRARDHGVNVAYLQGLGEAGYKGLPLDEVVRMRDHGVTSAFIRRVSVEGRLEPDQLIRLRDRGN
jgi:hypothetical protein